MRGKIKKSIYFFFCTLPKGFSAKLALINPLYENPDHLIKRNIMYLVTTNKIIKYKTIYVLKVTKEGMLNPCEETNGLVIQALKTSIKIKTMPMDK